MAKKILVALAILLYPTLIVVGNFYPFAGGAMMQQAFARGPWVPTVGQTYVVNDYTTGRTYNVSVLAIASSFSLPAGYTRSSLACVDGSVLASCEAGVEATFSNGSGRIVYTTPSHASRQAQYDYNRTVQPATIEQPRASWIHENEALAVGDAVGGPAGPPDNTGPIDITPLSNGDYIIDYAAPFGIYSIVVGPGSIT